MKRGGLHLAMLLGAWVGCAIVARGVPVDRDDTAHSLRLNGKWQFLLVDRSRDRSVVDDFMNPEFDASTWPHIDVPGNWEIQGFESPRYYRPDEAKLGLYRLAVKVPAEWRDEQVLVQFDGVAFGMTLYVNGREVGSHESAFLPVQFDLTPFVERESAKDNGNAKELLIAVKVYRDRRNAQFDTNDDWALSGIFRDVTLFTAPRIHFADTDLSTTEVDPAAHTARLRVRADIRSFRRAAPKDGQKSQMKLTLADPSGKTVYERTHEVVWPGFEVFPDFDVTIPVTDARLWNAETPALYDLTMELSTPGFSAHIVRERVGLRRVTIDDGILKLNGQRIKLRGVCRHDEWPDVGRAVREEQWRRDIELIKAANFNAVRCSHYPPARRFLELCDELGLYVLDEVPAGFGEQYLNDPAMQGDLLSRAEETVRLDRNHACVIMRSIGNENPLVEPLNRAAQLVKLLDPSRPTYFAGGNFAGRTWAMTTTGAAPFVDLTSKHYADLKWLSRATTQPTSGHPLVFSEINHALDLGFEGFAARWDVVEHTDAMAGAFVWLWADQGLLRKIDASVRVHDSYTAGETLKDDEPSGDIYLDDHTLLDSHGQFGSDGIVYADRTPQTDYFQAKAVLSPVKIEQHELKVAPGRQELSVDVTNRYDFTDLRDLTGRWELDVEGVRKAKGEFSIECPPHDRRQAKLVVDVPAEVSARATFLRIVFTDRRGVEVVDHRIALVAGGQRISRFRRSGDAKAVDVSIDDDGKLVVRRRDDGRTLVHNWSVHVGRQPTMGERITYARAKHPIWEPTQLDHWRLLDKRVSTDGDVTVTRVAVECRADGSDRAVDGIVTYRVNPRGSDGGAAVVDIDYDLSPRQTDAALLEFGLSCEIPAPTGSVRWIGNGPYPALPLKETLDQLGAYSISFADLFFAGNRTQVTDVELLDGRDAIVSLNCDPANIGWEPTRDGGFAWRHKPLSHDVRLTHCAKVASPGTKFDAPDVQLHADQLKNTTGAFRLTF
jgi:beta-galactosidase